jgi:tetratricopeptide (TPR) repeat protein
MSNPVYAVASALLILASSAAGAQSLREQARAEAELDGMFVELADPETRDWEAVEARIIRTWTQAGSAFGALLLKRGQEAMEAEDYAAAIDHFSALIDHEPEFAEAWNARATAYYMIDEYGLAIRDVGRVLVLNPRHFGALAGLGFMLEEMGDEPNALLAYRAVLALHPHRENVKQAAERLERRVGEVRL